MTREAAVANQNFIFLQVFIQMYKLTSTLTYQSNLTLTVQPEVHSASMQIVRRTPMCFLEQKVSMIRCLSEMDCGPHYESPRLMDSQTCNSDIRS